MLFIFSEQVSLKILKLLILVFKVVGVSEIVLNIAEVFMIKQIIFHFLNLGSITVYAISTRKLTIITEKTKSMTTLSTTIRSR